MTSPSASHSRPQRNPSTSTDFATVELTPAGSAMNPLTTILLAWCLVGPAISQFVSTRWYIALALSGPGGMLAFIVRMIAILIQARRLRRLAAQQTSTENQAS